MTRTSSTVDSMASQPRSAAQALAAAVANLRERQDPQGWWKGDLDTNVTMDAEDLLLREFLSIRTAGETEEAARWIRSQQREDGSWAVYYGGPGELSTTVEAWVALRLAGDAADAPHLARAAEFVRANGGLERSRVFTRIWLAMFGLWSWDDLPHLPPELIFFPKWFPFNVYDWGCWARQTIVPLTIVCTLRPVRSLPFGVDELRTGSAALRPEAAPAPPWTWAGFFQRTDRVLHAYSRRPVRPLRRAAMRRAAEWILARQEADGCWGGIQPPWVYSLLALHLLGYSLDHPSLRAGLAGLEGFVLREKTADGWVRRLEACQSPVWDTVLAVTALLDAGVPADDPAVAQASDWLLGEEVRVPGDWAVRRPGLAPGGWAFEFHNDTYPDTDDTAEAVLALRRVGLTDRSALDRGVAWLIGMQCKDGGWGAFDADNTRTLCTKLPFCDFGEVIDPPSADVTAHVVEALAAEGLADGVACRRGVQWLLAAQEPDGSWFGRWGANYVYGIGGVVPALIAAGIAADSLCIRRAIRWLEQHQNDDGGWGEDLRSYDNRAWAGRGESTASQTAWALLALLAAGEGSDARERGEQLDVVRRGVRWLCDTQRSDGSWDEPQFTGTGFPGDFYINYHLYRMVFPITALGRYLGGGAP
ncbi:MAG: squalene-hopene/tetraprenyl-beta-curcumene cyclase [Pseudonocardiales bacterium]|jgi:squalene-hopene/tetraprenyl-beta-curcumene cyclase|nr:squalene-hopene/tetraprenyl-beta-curcumene cyclase [Pseudonocardiales bacterium]